MRFTFRADASSATGFGHLSRVVALASAAGRAGAAVGLVASRPEPAVQAFAARAGLSLHPIEAEPGTAEDARALRAAAGSRSHVVVDGYAFRARYLEELAGESRIVTYIDDLAREPLSCDVVLNPNVSALSSAYETPVDTLLVLGPSFAIVHDSFVEARRKRAEQRGRDAERPRRVLVTMGGSDPPGATLAVLDALACVEGPRMQAHVVVGATNPREKLVRAAASACTQHDVDVLVSVEDMAAEMLWADLVVTASGVTATEVACVGVPGVTFAIVDNQAPIATELARLGMFDVLSPGTHAVPSPSAIASAIMDLADKPERRVALVVAQRSTIDGAGKDRVIARLLALRASDRHTHRHHGGERG